MVFIALIILIIHFIILFKHAVNIPYWDDFDSVLHFLDNYLEADSLSDKFSLLVSRHNEHRIILNRVASILQFYIFGTINFQGLIIFGNVLLALLFILLVLHYRRQNYVSWINFLPIPFIFFSLNAFEAFLWSMVSISTFGVLLFSFAAIFVLFTESKTSYGLRFVLAFLAATAATFTNGNGFLTFVICLAGLVLHKKKYKYILIWIVGTSAVLYFNFKGFHPIFYHPQPLPTLRSQPDQLISHFFTLLGNYFQTYNSFNNFIILIAGFFITSLFLYLFIPQKLFIRDSINFFFLVFLLLSCATTSLNRAGFGYTQALSPRYQIYSSLIVIFVYLCLLRQPVSNSKIKNATIVVFLVICILNYLSAYKMKMINARDLNFSLNYASLSYKQKEISNFSFPDQPTAAAIINRSEKSGTYKLPYVSYKKLATSPVGIIIPEETNTINAQWSLTDNDSLILIENGWAYLEGRDYVNCETYIVLQSKEQQYVFPTYRHFRPDVTSAMQAGALDWSGFSLTANRAEIKDGVYKIGILVKEVRLASKPHYGFEFTGKVLINNPETHPLVAETRDYEYLTPLVIGSQPEYFLDLIELKGNKLKVRGWAFLRQIHSESVQISLELISENDKVRLPIVKEPREDVANAFNGNYTSSGFISDFELKDVQKGEYSLKIILTCVGEKREILIENKISFK